MKARAFYQQLERSRSLAHRLVADGLFCERVDNPIVDLLTVDRLRLVESDHRLVVHRVYGMVLDRVDLLVVDRLLVERWLVDRLIVQFAQHRKDRYIPRPWGV